MRKNNICHVVHYQYGESGDRLFIYKTYKGALSKYKELRDDDKKYAEEMGLTCDESVIETKLGKRHYWASYEKGNFIETHATLTLESYQLL